MGPNLLLQTHTGQRTVNSELSPLMRRSLRSIKQTVVRGHATNGGRPCYPLHALTCVCRLDAGHELSIQVGNARVVPASCTPSEAPSKSTSTEDLGADPDADRHRGMCITFKAIACPCVFVSEDGLHNSSAQRVYVSWTWALSCMHAAWMMPLSRPICTCHVLT